jgi:class 3 adenylate cyclase
MASPGTTGTLTADELASRTGTTAARILDLTERGVLRPAVADRYEPGDIHRIRAVDAFEAAGVPLEALVEAAGTGRVSFAYYDELHQPPGEPSARTYAQFKASLGPLAAHLPLLYVAVGLAEPDPAARLEADEESFIADLLAAFAATGQPEIAIRVVRLFAESVRLASEAALGVYGDVVAALDPELAGLPPDVEYERLFVPWARIARAAPDLARWLTARHMSQAIDAYSVEATERILEQHGFVPERPDVPPGIAFVDLTGFTRVSEERGDEAAAGIALRLGELARTAAASNGGRVVKLLGDGVLLRLPNAARAVDATLDLLESLRAVGLPSGHAGIHAGPLIEREGDVFGRSVNLAARVSDAAPPGEVYVTQAVAASLGDSRHAVEPVASRELRGIGAVELYRVLAKGD